MSEIVASEYTDFIEGNFQDKAELLRNKYGCFDFVFFDCGSKNEYEVFFDRYWEMCTGYVFFHFTYINGEPNIKNKIIREHISRNSVIFDIVEPHKSRQGSITMVNTNVDPRN